MSGTKRISALTELASTSVAGEDIVAVVDMSQASVTDKTKHMQVSSLLGSTASDSKPKVSFKTVAAFTSDNNSHIGYSGSGAKFELAEGDIFEAGGFRYSVRATGASDNHVASAGGFKANVLPIDGEYDAKAFGAKGDGTTNDRLIIKAAADSVSAAGGGVLLLSGGNFLISGTQDAYDLPALSGSLAWSTESTDVQMYFSALSDITFRFNGASIVSDKTNGGITLLFDGCNNITFDGLHMTGETAMSGSTVTTTGTTAVALLSTTQNSSNITFNAPKIDAHYTGIDIVGDPSSSYRVNGVSINGAASIKNGYYGVACRGNGVNVNAPSLYTYRLNRPFFVYDTHDVKLRVVGDDMNGGFQSIIKAYTENTTAIDVDFVVKNRANTQSCLGLQSQHNPATQATPAYLKNIRVKYSDIDCVAGAAIRFAYYRDSSETSTSSGLLFDDIIIEGSSVSTLTSSVQLTSASNFCKLSIDKFSPSNNYAIFESESGFIPSNVLTWTPADGSGAGLTLATANGRYTVGSGYVVTFDVTYPATADGTSASISGLPFVSYALPRSAVGVMIGYTDCGLDIYGLVGSDDSKISFYKNTGSGITNAELSGKTVRGSFMYF